MKQISKHGEIKPRPSLQSRITSYAEAGTFPFEIERIEIFRTEDGIRHTLAIANKGRIYELFTEDHPEHPPLFGDMK